MATATEETKAKSVEDQLGDLRKDFSDFTGSLKDVVKALDQPNIHAGEGTVTYWEDAAPTRAVVPVDEDGMPAPRGLPKRKRAMPKGYKPQWNSFGEYIQDLCVSTKAQNMAAFKSRFDAGFKDIKDESVLKAVQGMSIQDGSSLGYAVLPEFNLNPLGRTYQNDVWGRTDQYTVNDNMVFLANAETSRATGSRNGGLAHYWVDEGGAYTKSKPTMRRIEVSLKKVCILVYFTEESLTRSAIALEQLVRGKSDEEFNFALGNAFFNGSGVQMPLGILNSPAFLSITKETGQLAATIMAENIDKMWARRYVGGNYSWFHNQDCGPQLDQLTQAVGTGGHVLYRPQDGIAGQMPMMLKSAPHVETEFNATLGTVGDLVLADPGQYISINKGGVFQAVSTELEFLTDQTALKLTMYVNGRPWETTPTTPFKGSNTQASFLGIETRS